MSRQLAERVLSCQAAQSEVQIRGYCQPIRHVLDLPSGELQVVGIGCRCDSGVEVNGDFLGEITRSSDLQELKLHGCKVTDDVLAYLPSMPNLRVLDLTDCSGISDTGLGYLQRLQRLQRLDLSYCAGLTDKALVPVAALESLQELSLASTPISDAGLKYLRTCTDLRNLGLRYCEGITDAGLAYLAALRGLREIDLCHTNIGSNGVKHLQKLTDLRRIELYDTELDNSGLERLAALTELRVLHVGNSGGDADIDNDGLASVASLPRLEELRLLDVAVTDIGIARLAGLRRLQRLVLGGCSEVSGESTIRVQGHKHTTRTVVPSMPRDYRRGPQESCRSDRALRPGGLR